MSEVAKQLLRNLNRDDRQFEKILGHRQKTDISREYLVKLVGKRYGLSEWITEDELKSQMNGQMLLSRYNHLVQSQKSEPPYYDAAFDIPDYIIANSGSRWLVKWKHLWHEYATWEDSVDKQLIEQFEKRTSLDLPMRDSDVSQDQKSQKKVKLEQYFLSNRLVTGRSIVSLNFLLACWHRGIDAKFVDSLKFEESLQCLAFLDYLMREENESGPFLCLVSSKSLNDWYDICRGSEIMVPLLYGGSKLNIDVINEIDFWQTNGKLKFNVLLTTIDVMSQQLERLSSINWRVMMVTDVPFQFDENSRIAKMISRMNAHFKIIFSATMWTSQSEVVCAYSDVFASEEAKSLASQDILESYELMKQTVEGHGLKPSTRVSIYSVNCPLSDFQRFMCKMALIEQQDRIQAGDFTVISREISRICVHPFTIYGTEKKYSCPDFLTSSTKIQVMDVIVKKALDDRKSVLICTDFPLLKSFLVHELDYQGMKCREWNQESCDCEDTSLFVCCKWDSDVKVPLKEFQVVILLNSNWSLWTPMLNEISHASGGIEKVYMLECLDCRENELGESCMLGKMDVCDKCCRNAAFHVIVDKKIQNPQCLVDEALLIDCCDARDFKPRSSSFADKEFTGDDFWKSFFEASNVLKVREGSGFLAKNRHVIDESSNWTIHQRDRFVDGFFSFGWNRPNDVMLYSGLSIDPDFYEILCRGISRVLLQSVRRHHTISYDLLANFVRASQGESDTSVEDMAVMSKCVFGNERFQETLQRKAHKLIKRISVLHFIRSFTETAGVEINDISFSQAGLAPWWTCEHDRALCHGICKYGMSHYEFFGCDADQRIRDIYDYHNGKRLSYTQLNKRAEEIATQALEAFMNMSTGDEIMPFIKDMSLASKWKTAEIHSVIEYLEKHGIDIDRNGSYDWEALANSLESTGKTPEQMKDFVEQLLAKCDHPDKGVDIGMNSLLRLSKRIDGMHKLRMIFAGHTDSEVKNILVQSPRWRAMPETWTPDLEFAWLSELLETGFGVPLSVLDKEEIRQLWNDGDVPVVLRHDLHIIQRITAIFEYAKTHFLLSESIRQQFKPRKLEGAASTVAQTQANDPDSLEYPIMITPNSFIHNIGTIEWKRPGFHSERYIYPVGFKTSRFSASLDNPDERTRWYSEIIDTGENSPVFRVWMEGRPNTIFQGVTPTAPWSQALKAVASCRRNKGKVSSISGPEAFLLASPIATYLIQNLPNADKCTNYVMRNVSSNPQIKRLHDKTQEVEPEPESEDRKEDHAADAQEDGLAHRRRK